MRKLLGLIFIVLSLPAYAQTIESRDIYLNGAIDDELAATVTQQIRTLNSQSHEEITLHITSYGGSVYSGLQIYDAIQASQSPIKTICEGYCMSMGAIILQAGYTRESQPNATILVHGVSMGAKGKIQECENELSEGKRLQALIDSILIFHTHKNAQEVQALEAYDHYMSPNEALSAGLIDRIN